MFSFKKAGPVEWLVVGLGNPGPKYEWTRHNVGFLVVDELAERASIPVQKLKYKALTNTTVIGGQSVLLMKPTTYMNLSGESVGQAARFYKIPPERVLVISDDVALPQGKLRIRRSGSAGGHNGLKNIIAHLGTDQFPRLKVGVGGKPYPDSDMADWVLGKFTGQDKAAMEQAMTPDAVGPLAADSILITRHLIDAMPQHFSGFRPVAALRPGVLGTTGVESAEAVRGLVDRLHPSVVIAVDALASRRVGRVCCTVQFSDTGIIPGSGVGNHRSALNRETLGVPVLAVGVPTVVDAATLAADLLEESGLPEPDLETLRSRPENLMVTPRDIDQQVRDLGKVIGYGINWALQDLEVDEINTLLS